MGDTLSYVIGWSKQKKAWCCEHGGQGCPEAERITTIPTTSLPFDCEAGYNNMVRGWSIAKKRWCCQHSGRGCPTTPTTTTLTTTLTTTTTIFDCDAGYS